MPKYFIVLLMESVVETDALFESITQIIFLVYINYYSSFETCFENRVGAVYKLCHPRPYYIPIISSNFMEDSTIVHIMS